MGNLVVLMGPTGSGKSVQGDLLARDYDGVHLSSGNLLRQDPQSAATLINGNLAPAEEVERVVGEAVDATAPDRLIVLDGFPRTMSNVKWLEDELPRHAREIKRVILIDMDMETVLARLALRGRADDSSEAIHKKWELYESKTRPVIDHYRNLGVLEVIDGRGSIEDVHERMKAVLV